MICILNTISSVSFTEVWVGHMFCLVIVNKTYVWIELYAVQ